MQSPHRPPGRPTDGPVPSITSAPRGQREEMGRRTSRYLVSMGIRTLCLILAVVATGWLQWAFLAGAIILPYVAVVMANAGPARAAAPEFPGPPALPGGPVDEGPTGRQDGRDG